MGAVISRMRWVVDYVRERSTSGIPILCGAPAKGTVFLVDGVGGLQMASLVARRVFRQQGLEPATYLHKWQRWPVGRVLADLTCHRRNRLEGARLARIMRSFRASHPHAPLHVLAYSAGAAVAVFAAERLGPRCAIDTMILSCPALSPGYPLAAALRHVRRCYTFVSRRDWIMLGVGTTLLGTMDRRFGPAAGQVGFRTPTGGGLQEPEVYNRLTQIPWSEEMRVLGHFGHHVGCATAAFIEHHIVALLEEGRRSVS